MLFVHISHGSTSVLSAQLAASLLNSADGLVAPVESLLPQDPMTEEELEFEVAAQKGQVLKTKKSLQEHDAKFEIIQRVPCVYKNDLLFHAI